MRRGAIALFVLGLVAAAAAPAAARPQDPGQAMTDDAIDEVQEPAIPLPIESGVPPALGSSSVVDLGDLWHRVHHSNKQADDRPADQSAKKPFFFVSPSVTSKPSTGLAVGIASSLVFVAGDPRTTRISSGDWSVSDSVKAQAGTSIRYRIFTPENRWFVQGDNRLAWTSQTTYALGLTLDAAGERLKYERRRAYDTLFRQVRPRLFVGVGLNVNQHTNVRAAGGTQDAYDQSAYVAYQTQRGLPLGQQMSSGTSLGVFVDTRDNSINASRGWLASATYRTFFTGFLGGSSTWQLLELDARTYKQFDRAGRQKLGVWFLGEFVTGGVVPYLDLPAIADDTYGRSARGYTTGRYRGPHQLYGEAEYRATLSPNGLIGAVAFVNVTAIDGDSPDARMFDTLAPAAGAGLRVLLSKRSRANLCFDYGRGREGSQGFYLAVRETF